MREKNTPDVEAEIQRILAGELGAVDYELEAAFTSLDPEPTTNTPAQEREVRRLVDAAQKVA